MMKSTAAQAIEMWPIERLIPYVRNARVCPESAITKVAGSIHEFGFKNPILVDGEGVVIAGHTRLLAAQRLGLTEVPVIVCADLSAAQVKALRIADNRTAQETSWDEELLPLELAELIELGADLAVLGFDEEEFARLLAPAPNAGLTDPDEVPEPPERPVSRPGDLWTLGPHRLLCGDATDKECVARLMNGRRATLMATDPPYLVDYDGGNHPQSYANRAATREKHWDSYTDHESSVAFYATFLGLALEGALTQSAAVYQWFGALRADVVLEAWREVGLLAHQQLIWVKSRPVLARSHYMWDYEPCMYGWKKGHMPAAKPPANARAVWPIDSRIEDGAVGVHPTQKPIETVRRPIAYHTTPGEVLYEPFSGSGTALIACEESGRLCSALELSPAFCDVAIVRWQNFTGKQASHESEGCSFAELAASRTKAAHSG